MNQPKMALHWPNVIFLAASPVLALVAALCAVKYSGFHRIDLFLFITLFFLTGLSITAGYHRLFAHVSYKAHPIVRYFLLIFGACAMENSAMNWGSDHRLHHAYTDTDKDPYNAGRGFWSSHIGWIFYQSRPFMQLRNVHDLLKDRAVKWQHRNHVYIALTVGFGLPFLIGAFFGRPFQGLVWGGLVRLVLVHHMTFFINSLAHMYGDQPYSLKDTSKDSWWLAVLTNGEGYHNFHHHFPSDYRNGIQWFHWDPTKWLIAGLEPWGLTHHLHRMPAHLIAKARLEVDAYRAEQHLQRVPVAEGASIRVRLAATKIRLEQAWSEWSESCAKYRELKANRDSGSAASWKLKIRVYRSQLKQTHAQWRQEMQSVKRLQPIAF